MAGHVTTQHLGGKKKICWAGGVAECFDCCSDKLYGFQNLEQSLRTTCFIWVQSQIFASEEVNSGNMKQQNSFTSY